MLGSRLFALSKQSSPRYLPITQVDGDDLEDYPNRIRLASHDLFQLVHSDLHLLSVRIDRTPCRTCPPLDCIMAPTSVLVDVSCPTRLYIGPCRNCVSVWIPCDKEGEYTLVRESNETWALRKGWTDEVITHPGANTDSIFERSSSLYHLPIPTKSIESESTPSGSCPTNQASIRFESFGYDIEIDEEHATDLHPKLFDLFWEYGTVYKVHSRSTTVTYEQDESSDKVDKLLQVWRSGPTQDKRYTAILLRQAILDDKLPKHVLFDDAEKPVNAAEEDSLWHDNAKGSKILILNLSPSMRSESERAKLETWFQSFPSCKVADAISALKDQDYPVPPTLEPTIQVVPRQWISGWIRQELSMARKIIPLFGGDLVIYVVPSQVASDLWEQSTKDREDGSVTSGLSLCYDRTYPADQASWEFPLGTGVHSQFPYLSIAQLKERKIPHRRLIIRRGEALSLAPGACYMMIAWKLAGYVSVPYLPDTADSFVNTGSLAGEMLMRMGILPDFGPSE